MRIVKPPFPVSLEKNEVLLFLGGTIDMGNSENWQAKVEKILYEKLGDVPLVIANPRRDDWDSTWVQDPTPGTQFHGQVNWELQTQQESDVRLYNILGDSKSPITLLEIGLFGGIVVCDSSFYRYGNVKMACDFLESLVFSTLEEAIERCLIPTIKSFLEAREKVPCESSRVSCPNMDLSHSSMEGETWHCKVCGDYIRLDYEDMK